MNKDDSSVGTGMVGAPACGDVMKLQIKVNAQGVIEDAKFKTMLWQCDCSSSLLTEWSRARPWTRRSKSDSQIAEELHCRR